MSARYLEPLFNHDGLIRNARLMHWADIDAHREQLVRGFEREAAPLFSDSIHSYRLSEDRSEPLPDRVAAICGDYLQLEKLEAMRVGRNLLTKLPEKSHVAVLYAPDSGLHTALGMADAVHATGHAVSVVPVHRRQTYPMHEAAPTIDPQGKKAIVAADRIILCDSTISSGSSIAHALQDIEAVRKEQGLVNPIDVTVYSNLCWQVKRDARQLSPQSTLRLDPLDRIPFFHAVWDEKHYTAQTGLKLQVLIGSDNKAHDIFDRGNGMAMLDHPQAHRWRDYLSKRKDEEKPLSSGLRALADRRLAVQSQPESRWHQQQEKSLSFWER